MNKKLLFLMLSAFTFVCHAQVELLEEDAVVEISNGNGTGSTRNLKYDQTPKSIKYNDNYSVNRIVDDYDFFSLKNASYSSKKYGISQNGQVILPMIFSSKRYNYSDGRIILGIKSNIGVYNLYTDNWDIPLKYESANSLGQDLYSVKKDGKHGVVDQYDEIIVPFEWTEISTIRGLDNYIMVSKNVYPNKIYGIYSIIERKIIIPCEYSNIQTISNQNAFIITKDNKMNIVDINNKKYFKEDYEGVYLPENGRNNYIVKQNGLMGIISQSEEVIVPIEYFSIAINSYTDGSYLAQNKDGKFGCLLIDGTISLPFEYEAFQKQGSNNLMTIKNGKCGIVQLNSGSPFEIVTCDYDDLKKTNSVFVVEKNNKFGLLNEFGKIIVPIEYEELTSFSTGYNNKGLFKGKKDGKYYLINSFGRVLNSTAYYNMDIVLRKESNYYGSSKFVYIKVQSKNKKHGLIDVTGRVILEPMFDDIISDNKNTLVIVIDGKFGLYNVMRKEYIVPAEYDYIVKNNRQFVGYKNNKFVYIKFVSGKVNIVSAIIED